VNYLIIEIYKESKVAGANYYLCRKFSSNDLQYKKERYPHSL